MVWRCISRLENTGLFCDARTVPESQIEQVLVAAINQTLCDKNTFLATLQRNIETGLESEKDQPFADIDNRLAELQEELLKRTGVRADYEDIAEEIYRLREDKQKLQLESAGRDKQKKRISDMGTFLREQPTALTEYDHTPSGGCDALVRRLIEKVTVYTASADATDKFIVEFKSGVTVDVNE